MEYYFRTEQFSVGYHKKPLIEQIEIGLQKGEILTLIGPNGAGKSTVLKSIARQLEKISGTVYLEEKDWHQADGNTVSKTMAVVLTDKLRTEMMSCEEVVASGRYPYTGRFGFLSHHDREIVRETMELVQIGDIMQQDFTKISDGQRQRVMLARAICQEPEIILLDEPTSFLDVKYKLEFLSILQRLCRERQLTVIMSLHELELAEKISDRVMAIKGNRVDRFGTPDEIFTAGYVSELFDIRQGSFDEIGGVMELQMTADEPEVFVIGGDGLGRGIYRNLQRKGSGFVAGILYENDLDYPVAKALAAEILVTKSFEPIPEEMIELAKKKIDQMQRVISVKQSFGTYEQANRELYEYAKAKGKLSNF